MKVDLLIADAEVDGRRLDVAVSGGRVVAIGPTLSVDADTRHDAAGGALLPGLHDHHIHLLATAAAMTSIDLLTTPEHDTDTLVRLLRRGAEQLTRGAWLRVVGYHESIAGELTRDMLDRLTPPGHPVRVQHRSGAMWALNGLAVAELGAALDDPLEGIERDETGRPTGRLFRLDSWLRQQLPPTALDLSPLDREITAAGITGVTDMTPYASIDDCAALVSAVASGVISAHVTLTGGPAMSAERFPAPLVTGPVKLIVDDHNPPPFDDAVEWIRDAHGNDRPVAVHAVTRAGLAYSLAVWREAGSRRGDRLEHGAVVPPELRSQLFELGVQVVTQPAFVCQRGDHYLDEVDSDDVPHLWPCASLLAAGIGVGAGSDSPYGPLDPWIAIESASSRLTPSGRPLGAAEIITPRRALGMFLSDAADAGGSERTLSVGVPSDLCLLDRPLASALTPPVVNHVVKSWVGVASAG